MIKGMDIKVKKEWRRRRESDKRIREGEWLERAGKRGGKDKKPRERRKSWSITLTLRNSSYVLPFWLKIKSFLSLQHRLLSLVTR